MLLEIEKNSLHQMVDKTTHGNYYMEWVSMRQLLLLMKWEQPWAKKMPREVLDFNKANTTEISSISDARRVLPHM